MSNSWTAARKVIVPAGTYWLCDPCYIVADEEWCKVLDRTDCLNETYKDSRGVIVAFSTKYGDGTYEDQYGNKYPVDAGLIGLTDVRFNPEPDQTYTKHRQVTFTEPTPCKCSEGCDLLVFGDTQINTDD